MQLNSRQSIFTFLVFFFVIIGSAYTIYLHFDYLTVIDLRSYIKMAQGDFDVNVTHRYRVIIPFLAKVVSLPISKIYTALWPHRAESLWPLRLGFLLVNSTLLSLTAYFILKTCLAYSASFLSSLLAVINLLVSRFAIYIAGLPRIDSLYLLIIALVFYGIKTKSYPVLILSILLGPLAKESFIFLIPIIFFYAPIPRKQQIALYLLSALPVLTVHYFIDTHLGLSEKQSISNALAHFENIAYTFRKLASVRGLGEIISVFGFFNLVLIIGLTGGKEQIRRWSGKIDGPLRWWLLAVMVHIFLSGDAGRMAYLAAPTVAVMMALILDLHPKFEGMRRLVHEKRWEQGGS